MKDPLEEAGYDKDILKKEEGLAYLQIQGFPPPTQTTW